MASQAPGAFAGVRVIEIGDEKGDFAGRLLSGEGCDVVKVEPPGGSPSRRIGPFYQDKPDPNRSLFFWMYNRGKQGVTIDLSRPEGKALYLRLAATADVIVDAQGFGVMDGHGLGYQRVAEVKPDVVYCAITPFGQDGPWRDFKASDLVHLALGGGAYCIGYDPVNAVEGQRVTEAPRWDTPPIMPQAWHAYCKAGEHASIGIAAAPLWRQATGQGQFIDVSIHDACAQSTEATVSRYIYYKMESPRRTPSQVKCSDGLYLNFMLGIPARVDLVVATLIKDGFGEGLGEPKDYSGPSPMPGRGSPAVTKAIRRWAAARPAVEAMRALQACRTIATPVYRPEDLPSDPQAIAREDFVEIEHPELGRSFLYPRHPRRQTVTPFRWGPRAPLVGEHNAEVLGPLV